MGRADQDWKANQLEDERIAAYYASQKKEPSDAEFLVQAREDIQAHYDGDGSMSEAAGVAEMACGRLEKALARIMELEAKLDAIKRHVCAP